MLIIPAIDLKDGCVVRLVQGNLKRDVKVYSKDPIKTAKHWVKQGADLIHIVDLDGASTGTPANLEVVKEIARAVSVGIEFGGGVRDIETIQKIVDSGIRRVVLGTKAAQDQNFLKKAIRRFNDKIIVSIDARDGKVLIKGWQENSAGLDALAFAQKLKEIGFKEIIYTDISKDGTLKGPDIKGVKSLLKDTGLKIIVSGGISSLEDISRVKLLENSGVTGIIIGKALYEGKFTLAQALKVG